MCQSLCSRAATMIWRSASALRAWNVVGAGPPAAPARGPALSWMSAGMFSTPIVSPSVAMIIRSTTFRSSRTLFRVQSYRIRQSSAAGSTVLGRTPKRAQVTIRRCSTSAGMSDNRSRSAGTRTTWTLSRKYTSSRKRPARTSASRSRFVAATTRAVTATVRFPPSRVICRCSMTRSSFACAAGGSSPISSRNNVPPDAASNAPLRSAPAPVNAPRSWPNSSSSTRFSGMAAALSAMNGPPGFAPKRCRSRATSSFPDPLSPTIRTGLGIFATRPIASLSACMAGLAPTSGASESRRPQDGELPREALLLERVLDLLHHAFHRLGLVDEAPGAEPDGLRATVVVARPGVDEHRHPEPTSLHGSQHFEAVHPRHFQVEDDAVHRFALQQIERRAARERDEHVVAAHALQVVRVLLRHGGYVVHDQDGAHHVSPGSSTMNALPAPGSVSTRNAPLASSTRRRTIDRPRPVPPGFVV